MLNFGFSIETHPSVLAVFLASNFKLNCFKLSQHVHTHFRTDSGSFQKFGSH